MRKLWNGFLFSCLGLLATGALAAEKAPASPFGETAPRDSVVLQWVRVLESQGERALAWRTLHSLEREDCETRRIAFRLLMKQRRFAAARDSLRSHPNCFEAESREVLSAALALKLDEPAAALAHLDAQDPPPGLEAYGLALRADALRRLERWDEARQTAQAALSAPLPRELQRPLRIIEAQACFALGETERLRALAPRLGEDARFDDRTGLLLIHLARTALQEGEREQARQWLLDLLQARPAPAESAYALLRRVEAASTEPMTVEEELALARYEDRNGHAAQARQRLQTLSARPSLSRELEGEIWTTLAGFLRRQGRTQECLAFLDAQESRIAGTRAEADSWLLRGRCHRSLGDEAKTIESYREMARRFPDDSRADDALYEVAWRHEIGGDFDGAADLFASLPRRFPHSTLADDALFRVGLCFLRSGRFSEALQAFADLETLHPRSSLAARSLYWRAWILERRGEAKEAAGLRETLRREHEDSYFAILAAAGGSESAVHTRAVEDTTPEGDRASRSWSMAWSHQRTYADAIAALRQGGVPATSPRFTRDATFWRFCLEHGLAQEAFWESARLEGRFAADPAALLELLEGCAERGMPERLVRLSYRLSLLVVRPDLAGAIEVLRYPAPYTVTLAEETEKYGLSHAVILGLMRQESAFDPRADSRAGARGLMQLMPAVGKRVAQEQGLEELHIDALYEPSLNVQLGCWLFAEELQRAEGRLPQTLAAYNAGSEPAAIWARRLRPEEPPELYLDVAEYLETRNYMDRVLLGTDTYRRLYGLR